jgi:hypothetical protein
MKLRKRTLVFVSSLVGAAFVLWVTLWIQLFACFPSECVYVASISPEGSKRAAFSVRYEGLYGWLPYDIEPRYYLTVTDTAHGWILLRKSAYGGDLPTSFSELSKKHAPWALTKLASAAK